MEKSFSFATMDCKLIVFCGLLAIAQSVPLASYGVETRIAGGQNARRGEFPYLVSLGWDMPPIAKWDYICGGAILNETWILTTANCLYLVPPSSIGTLRVKAGKHRFAVHEPGEQVAVVAKRIVHENFDPHSGSNNIALLKLEKPLRLNANVAPIKLPQANSNVTSNVTVAGWGITSLTGDFVYPKVLQKLNSTLADIRDCQKSYENVANITLVSADNNFCTKTPVGQSVCFGDTGVPVITNEPREVVGLVSWVMHPCSQLDLPQVHVKVSSFVDWIRSKIANETSYSL